MCVSPSECQGIDQLWWDHHRLIGCVFFGRLCCCWGFACHCVDGHCVVLTVCGVAARSSKNRCYILRSSLCGCLLCCSLILGRLTSRSSDLHSVGIFLPRFEWAFVHRIDSVHC